MHSDFIWRCFSWNWRYHLHSRWARLQLWKLRFSASAWLWLRWNYICNRSTFSVLGNTRYDWTAFLTNIVVRLRPNWHLQHCHKERIYAAWYLRRLNTGVWRDLLRSHSEPMHCQFFRRHVSAVWHNRVWARQCSNQFWPILLRTEPKLRLQSADYIHRLAVAICQP